MNLVVEYDAGLGHAVVLGHLPAGLGFHAAGQGHVPDLGPVLGLGHPVGQGFHAVVLGHPAFVLGHASSLGHLSAGLGHAVDLGHAAASLGRASGLGWEGYSCLGSVFGRLDLAVHFPHVRPAL